MNLQKKDRIQSFIRVFLSALTHVRQYTVSHKLTRATMEDAYAKLLLALDVDGSFEIMMIDDRVVVDKESLEDSIYTNRFVLFFNSRKIDNIRISPGITIEELQSFMEAVTVYDRQATALNKKDFDHIQYGKIGISYKGSLEASQQEKQPSADSETMPPDPDRIRHFERICRKELGLMSDIVDGVRRNYSLPDLEIKQVVTDIMSAIKEESSLLLTFSPLRILDEYTFTHSTNVCILALAQGMVMKMTEEQLHDVGVAAMLHDIGKIYVPEEILNKKGSLTDDEWSIIKQHPTNGARYLMDKPGIPPLAIIATYEHHMQFDFSGYPKVSGHRRQNICSQMITIADFFDSLRTKRAYRGSVATKEIASTMASMAGTTLNPILTKNFLLLLNTLMPAEPNPTEAPIASASS